MLVRGAHGVHAAALFSTNTMAASRMPACMPGSWMPLSHRCCCLYGTCCSFCNVRYVIALLRDLLVGLDVAQRVLGFTHYDLK